MGMRARLRGRPQPLSVINRFNKHNGKVDWFKARLERRRHARDWEPPSDTWWRDYQKPQLDRASGPRNDPPQRGGGRAGPEEKSAQGQL